MRTEFSTCDPVCVPCKVMFLAPFYRFLNIENKVNTKQCMYTIE